MMWILEQIVRFRTKEDGGTISAIALILMVCTKEVYTHKASRGPHWEALGIPLNTQRWNFGLIKATATSYPAGTTGIIVKWTNSSGPMRERESRQKHLTQETRLISFRSTDVILDFQPETQP